MPPLSPPGGEGEKTVARQSVSLTVFFKPFAAAELDMIAKVAAQLGITVQNSKLFERMKERDRLAALGEMAAGLACGGAPPERRFTLAAHLP